MHLFRFLPLLPSLSGVNSGCAKIRKEERKWSWENPPPCIFLFGEPRYAWHVAMSTQRGRVIFPFFVGTIVHFPISFLRKNPISSFMPVLLHFFGDISGDGQIHFSTRLSRCTPSYSRTNLSQFPNPLGAPGHISVLGQFHEVHLNS